MSHSGWQSRRVVQLIAILAAGIWLVGTVRAEAPTPAWQQPPTSGEFNTWASDSHPGADASGSESGCACESGDCEGQCGAGDDVGCNYGLLCGLVAPHDYWVRTDALLWWMKGGSVPPLLTTSPNNTPQAQAGVLNQAGTVILLGNRQLNKDMRAGGRISFGTWFDECDTLGIDISYLGFGQNTDQLAAASDGSSILARPFFNVDGNPGKENSHLIAYPNLTQGDFTCSSTSKFQAAECLARWAIVHAPGYRVELLGGYRFQQLADDLDISEATGTASPSTTILISDQFHARNDFQGAEVGVMIEKHRCRWSVESSLKLALGNTRSRIDISGATSIAGTPYSGGLLALPSNMGVHTADQFSVIPELGATVGYDLTCRLRATVGYTFMYWSNVSRPGDQIDLNVSPAQFPPPTGTSTKPAFVQHTSDFWAQGVNVGLDFRF